MPIDTGIEHATAHHEKNDVDQSRRKVDANSQISAHYYLADNNEESDHVNKVNEDVKNKAIDEESDLMIHDSFEENDASTTIEQELQIEVDALDNVEDDKVDKANNADGHASTDSDDRINVENKANDERAESMIYDGFEVNDTSTTIEQIL
jgi:hypothetical protein